MSRRAHLTMVAVVAIAALAGLALWTEWGNHIWMSGYALLCG